MNLQMNSPADRRMSSFRIDDILARPYGSRSDGVASGCITAAIPSPVQGYQHLNFGVDQILARSDSEHRERLSLLGGHSMVPSTCDHLHAAAYWASPYLTAHTSPFVCGSLLHSNCEACYPHNPYSFTSLTGLYGDYGSSVLNKSLPGQVLPGQPKPRKPRRPWTRAVFSNLQRKGLEKRFQLQKYLTKADRHQLASMLGLSDNQVKVWFQNRRMKWRQEARETVTTASPDNSTDKPE